MITTDESKVCSTCCMEKPLEAFSIDRTRHGGKGPKGRYRVCKSCNIKSNRKAKINKYGSITAANRYYNLKYKYGITEEEIDQMKLDQDYKCRICLNRSILYVDHCHKTKKVRGVLCNECNTGLGKFKDSIEILQNALEYIRRSHDNN